MEKLKPILIVGAGSIGLRHLKNLHKLGWKNIVVLRRKSSPDFEKKYNVEVITDYNQLREKPFAVLVCNPTSEHLKPLKFAVDSGIHVFMEKPLIHSVDGLSQARELLKKHRKCFFIGYMLRYHPAIIKIKEILKSGRLENPYYARLEFGSYLPNWPYENYKKSYAARKDLGGGVINTISHEIDLIQFFFGDPKKVCSVNYNFDKLNIGVEEMNESIFSYEGICVSLHLDYLQKEYHRSIKILFDNGIIKWSWGKDEIYVNQYSKKAEKISLKINNINDIYLAELQHFIDLSVNSVFSHPLNTEHALKNTEILLKMHNYR